MRQNNELIRRCGLDLSPIGSRSGDELMLEDVVPNAGHWDHADVGLAQAHLHLRSLLQRRVEIFSTPSVVIATPTSVPILVKARSCSGRDRGDNFSRPSRL